MNVEETGRIWISAYTVSQIKKVFVVTIWIRQIIVKIDILELDPISSNHSLLEVILFEVAYFRVASYSVTYKSY